jgi:short-subunit dehydrogenase
LASPTSILITGASGAIGSALARSYATHGVTLVLTGRDTQRLKEIAAECRDCGATVKTVLIDLTDAEAVREQFRALDKAHRFSLVIINQGVNASTEPTSRLEEWSAVERLLDVNLRASFALCNAVLPGMLGRGCGQLALISSLAAYVGLPRTPTYSATKAGLKAYAEALRGGLAGTGVQINLVMPGYVQSAMERGMPGPKPFLWSPEQAAVRIKKGLARNRARICFPQPFAFGVFLLCLFPPDLAQRILGWLGYRGD